MVAADFGVMALILATFSMHVVMFGIEVILSLVVLGLLIYNRKTGDENALKVAYDYMLYISMTYASAHFFLTATTVFTLTFYPTFLILTGQALFYPLLWIFVALLFRLALIAWLYYGWFDFDATKRLVFSILFSLAGVVWIYLYMTLLAFMNTPDGLVSTDPMVIDNVRLFLNPTILPLLLTVVFGAGAVTLFILVFIYTGKLKKEENEFYSKLNVIYLKVGYYLFLLFIPSLLAYIFSLRTHSEHKFKNMVGWVFAQDAPTVDFGWMFFIILLLVVVALAVTSILVFKYAKEGLDLNDKVQYYMLMILGPVSAIIFEMVFLLNLISQNPYLIVAPELAADVPAIVTTTAVNDIANVTDVTSLAIFAMTPLFLAFLSLMYFIFSGRAHAKEDPNFKSAAQL